MLIVMFLYSGMLQTCVAVGAFMRCVVYNHICVCVCLVFALSGITDKYNVTMFVIIIQVYHTQYGFNKETQG